MDVWFYVMNQDNPYSLSEEEIVLLVGEGNFSFTKEFLTLNKNTKDIKIVSTCKESIFETFSEFKQNTIKYLQDKGVTVVLNVDATNLKYHPAIQNQKYSKVIFNFPHVGGKMKINLNRKLLKDFFCSACEVLNDNGSVIVALCDGQGGTGADKKKRRWDDSWQITEMAAQSDLILYNIANFDVNCFLQYVNVGYRSYDKSFHCENAVIHVFRKQAPPNIIVCAPALGCDSITKDLIHKFINNSMANPFSNFQSASFYIYENLKTKIGPNFNVFENILECDFNLETCEKSHPNKQEQMLTVYLSAQLGGKRKTNNIVARAIFKNKLILSDFSYAPVVCQMLIFGEENFTQLLHKYLCEIVNFVTGSSKCDINIMKDNTNDEKEVFILDINVTSIIVELLMLQNGIFCYIVNLDELAKAVFELTDWRSLWNGRIELDHSGHPTFKPTVLYSRAYAFDLGLSVPLHRRNGFEDELYTILWCLAGDLIVKTEHISTYFPTDRELVCYCYRITYKSFNAPFFRKRVIHIHENVIATFISNKLKVNIT